MRVVMLGGLLAVLVGCGSMVERDASTNADAAYAMGTVLTGLAGGALFGQAMGTPEGALLGTTTGAAVGDTVMRSRPASQSGGYSMPSSGSSSAAVSGGACDNPHDGPPVPANQFVCLAATYEYHICVCSGDSCEISDIGSNLSCGEELLGDIHL